MGNVLADVRRDNTRFTIFENDQVLTADQLNDLFHYLDVQTRLTRTKAIGIGIICGLEIGLLANRHMVVSSGAAITTDGDLLYFDRDMEFDQYEVFEDVKAKYPYFRLNGQLIPMYALGNSTTAGTSGKNLAAFEQDTNTTIQDYVGILYLEDYQNDPDVCTGTDCDNKGAEAVREPKVLLIHKNNLRSLLESIPTINKNYFALDDIAIPRVNIKNTINQYGELNTAFNDVLTIKEEIKGKLLKAYQVCQPLVGDEFEGSDPTTGWNTLLDQHFNKAGSIYIQYAYDFARDISFAYNELRETLFSDNMLCLPDLQLFPKHVMMGLVKTASFSRPLTSPLSSPIESPIASPLTSPLSVPAFAGRLNVRMPLFNVLRFDIGSLIRRFHPVHIDMEYRHHFYGSPVLNNNQEAVQHTKFCFMRLHAMIQNFRIPTAEELQNVVTGLRITPSHFEDQSLGKRSIPFYYRFDRNQPLHLYWSFQANVRKKEDEILSYFADQYASGHPATLTPLRYNLFPYNFFRVEGHIGFKRSEVEDALNRLIQEYNLPFNVTSIQVEREPRTIPRRPWLFPELHFYDSFVRSSFLEQMQQAEIVHNGLKTETQNLPESNNINLSMANFTNAKDKLLTHKPITDPEFDLPGFTDDVDRLIKATTEVKAQTRPFDFSHTAVPHDFIINTDVLPKANLLNDLVKQKEDKKKQALMLGNFIKQNPGPEHCGGVLRGGTFVLVYTSQNETVVADLMLPYYVADKDIDPDPPVIKPMPLPHPKIDLPKVFKIKPLYEDVINRKIEPFVTQFNNFGRTLQNNEKLFEKVVSVSSLKTPSAGIRDDIFVGGTDYTARVKEIQRRQRELETMPVDAPDRQVREEEFLNLTDALTKDLNKPEITGDESNALLVKSIMADVHTGTSLIQKEALKAKATEISNTANSINKGFNRIQ